MPRSSPNTLLQRGLWPRPDVSLLRGDVSETLLRGLTEAGTLWPLDTLGFNGSTCLHSASPDPRPFKVAAFNRLSQRSANQLQTRLPL
ncbi:hypothetical protein AAFF_G00292340 [Aldrovandia affinis]|uniref:Uncharacterized protein n=1 Tax=Aldrovandia affinis TaxID=143900 RepID=A0AAD7SQW1_9TELE|nr:hypothetical protein AAFF_G00292340 [Aldrovandia affinis]